MHRAFRVTPLLLLAVVFACQDRNVAPTAARPSFAAAAPAACPANPTIVVTDEAGLRTAIATVAPGAVIAIQGMIGLNQDDTIRTAGVTLTCATPGSGLFAVAGSPVQDLVIASAKKVVVDRLVLDGSQAADGPLAAFNDLTTFFAESIRFTNNTVTCSVVAGGGLCVDISGGLGPVVSDNSFLEPAPSFAGIHLQTDAEPIDGARVERNTVVATVATAAPRQGGIRVFGAANAVIADNTVVGLWSNSISPQALTSSVISGNQLTGPNFFGIRFSGNTGFTLLMLNNVVSSNRVTGAGNGGIFARLACGNAFVGNNLQGNAGNLGLLFDVATGANTYAGDRNVVVDNGAFDCNGDGVNDPNIISGPGMARHGLQLGGLVSTTDRQRSVHGIVLQ